MPRKRGDIILDPEFGEEHLVNLKGTTQSLGGGNVEGMGLAGVGDRDGAEHAGEERKREDRDANAQGAGRCGMHASRM